MTNREIGNKLGDSIREERQKTNEVLQLINLALERRVHLDFGFSSMFNWLVDGFGYSNAAAYRRIEAARLLKAVPEVKDKLESGQVNLTTISKVQSVVKTHERLTGAKVDKAQRAAIVNKIEEKSVREAEQTLLSMFPAAASAVEQEKKTVVSASQTRLHVTLSTTAEAHLTRAKEILSHKFPSGASADIIEFALNYLLEGMDPLRKKSKPNSTAGVRRAVINQSDAKCTFRDPISGKVCGSRYQVQIDHIVPKALGGSDDPTNLRTLCRQHNIHAAESKLGRQFMDKFRRQI